MNQTTDSIRQARAEQLAERQMITDKTGVVITDPPPPAFLICCTRRNCRFVASARSEGRAIRSLASHLVHHIAEERGVVVSITERRS